MAGHSKWAKVKHFKGAIDAKRGKIFSKLSKEISIAAKLAGPDPNMNPRLRMVLLKCRAANMPNDNIDRAIKKGIGGGQIIVSRDAAGEDQLMELALDAGAEDFKAEPEGYEILTEPGHFETVHKQIEGKGIKAEAASVTELPSIT